MKIIIFTWAVLLTALSICAEDLPAFVMDEDSNFYAIPSAVRAVPCLVYLSCTGGKPEYIDSVAAVRDSLRWAIAVSGPSRNHRDPRLNEFDILTLISRLHQYPSVDEEHIYLWGFSGQGAQALGTALRNPDLIAGAITSCAHLGLVTGLDPRLSSEQIYYIITREEDWNRQHNEIFHDKLQQLGIKDSLHLTPGEHGIGSHLELYEGAKYIDGLLCF